MKVLGLEGILATISREHSRQERIAAKPSVDKVANVVSAAYGIKLEEVVNREGEEK